MAIEIVDLPGFTHKKMMVFHSYVSSPGYPLVILQKATEHDHL